MTIKQMLTVAAMLSAVTIAQAKEPTTRPDKKDFPTPAQLIKKMQDSKTKDEKKLQVAVFNLTESISEKPSSFSLFGDESLTLRVLLDRLETARKDQSVKAVLFYMGTGTGLNLAQASELREELGLLAKAGKKTFAYADSYDTVSYVIASACTDVCLLGGGEIFIPGVGFETMFYKGTFDKLGVTADYVQIGEYKGAEEPYTRTEPSEELKGEMNRLVDSYYKQIVGTISQQRDLPEDTVRKVVDHAMLSGQHALDQKLVDHLTDPDGLRDLIKKSLGDDVNLVHHYGSPEREEMDMTNIFSILKAINKPAETIDKPSVAIVYAEGVISDGHAGGGLMSEGGIGSEDIRTAMRLAGRDENVKAVVIRIDSPGGSALASEAMWQSVRRVAKDKPVIISIGGMAASGGYYLASAGDYVVADPTAIVGSIGVVGGKFVMSGLYEKLGLSTTSFSRGENSNLFSSNSNFDDSQKKMVKAWMHDTYDQFTDRVKSARGDKIKDIDKIARGRIFLAADAKALGMVDELGGMRRAIRIAADRAKLGDDFAVQVLPPPTTLADMINGRASADAATLVKPLLQMNDNSMLRLLPHDVRNNILMQVQMMQLMESRPVILMSPFVVKLK